MTFEDSALATLPSNQTSPGATTKPNKINFSDSETNEESSSPFFLSPTRATSKIYQLLLQYISNHDMKFVSSVLTILVVALLSDASNAEQRRHLRVADNSDNNGSRNEGIVDSIDANTMNRIKQRYLMTLHGGRSRVNRSRDIRDRPIGIETRQHPRSGRRWQWRVPRMAGDAYATKLAFAG